MIAISAYRKAVSMPHNDNTPTHPRTVVIEEYYKEWHGKIIRYWRFEGSSNWHSQATPYKQLPYKLFIPDEVGALDD